MTSYNKSEQQAFREKHNTKKPWYNQGWLWLIVSVVALGTFIFLFQGLIDQLAQLTQATEDQTDAIQEQNQLLSGIQESMNQLIRELNQMAYEISRSIQQQTY